MRKCTKVLIGDTIFTSPTGDWTVILRGNPSHAKVSPLAVQKEYLHFSVILRPWALVPVPGIEPATSRSAVTRSTGWANTAAGSGHEYALLESTSEVWPEIDLFTDTAAILN